VYDFLDERPHQRHEECSSSDPPGSGIDDGSQLDDDLDIGDDCSVSELEIVDECICENGGGVGDTRRPRSLAD
jgi:hypothetical protein